jgi:MarR family transcriptional regulator, transcriptional regulator for hemolysin
MEAIFSTARNRKRSIGWRLTVIARQLRLNFDQRTKLEGLTRAKWTLITAVARNPGATQRAIAEALELREITVGRLIDRLCDEGYLRRSANRTDRRAYRVYLARDAHLVLEKLDALAKTHEAQIFAGFSNEDLEKLDEMLGAMARNLSAARRKRAG